MTDFTDLDLEAVYTHIKNYWTPVQFVINTII